MLSIGVWEDEDSIFDAAARYKLPWTQLYDYGSRLALPTSSTTLYGIKGIPHIILFAPDGTILCRNLRGGEIEQKLKELF